MNEHPEQLSHIPKHQSEYSYEDVYLAIEDELVDARVFISGFGESRRSSMLAYGTVIEFANLKTIVPKLLEKYGRDKMLYFLNTIQDYCYLSPIAILTALWTWKIMEGDM